MPTDQSPPLKARSVPVVGIGASAGGIHVLQQLFAALPAKLGAAVVVIVHLDPGHDSELASILQLRTAMSVTQVNGRLPLEADHVYVIPPDSRLMISGNDVTTAPFAERRGQRNPIDQFFHSLAEEHGDGYAVVLSGSGSDGSLGVRAVRENGGIVLVQDPDEAEYPMMPRSAIAAGADFVLPVAQISKQLAELVRNKARGGSEPANANDEDVLRDILGYIRVKTGQDFTHYKRPTVARRVARRMQVVQSEGLRSYFTHLRKHGEEVRALFNDLLISVTSFFRDPRAYAALAKLVIPRLLDHEPGRPIRVWVPGCATGEEAYSIAILLLEAAAARDVRPAIQVFASDLDAGALATARAGSYPSSIVADVSPERLARFFTSQGDVYCVRSELRDLVVFAAHGLLKDPPFSRLDLISCRNLMIYLDRDLQEQACRTFNYALADGGYLFLGSSETADHPLGLFTVVDREARIYQKSAMSAGALPPLPHVFSTSPAAEKFARAVRARAPPPASDFTSHRQALELMAPPSMLVDANHSILNLSETAGRYMLPPAGRVTSDAAAMVRPEMRLDLQAALHRAFEHGETSVTLPIAVRFNGSAQAVVLQTRPSTGSDGTRTALVLFIEGGAAQLAQENSRPADTSPLVVRLREELLAHQSLLRSMREQYETATEELRAANEELQSINEEYRSTAEELETSKEELQSINEELQTLNNELKIKLDMVSRAHSDLQNLMGATDIATLFLDKSMRIKRFTPRTTELFSIHAGDEGRPVSDFTHRLEYHDLTADAEKVLADLAPIERSIHTINDRWLTTRLRPYRTIDDKIEGVVVTFFDVTERRQAEAEWKARQEMLLQEFRHRVKNTLAVVQVIVRQTLKSSKSSASDPGLITRLMDRLAALARSHDLLVRSEWTSISLQELVRDQLSAHMAGDRLTIEGPDASLGPEVAAPLGLVLHELATNATKYGAFQTEAGRVALTWRTNGAGTKERLDLTWRETGGPPITAPASKGLGSRLITHAIPDASTRCEFAPQGVVWHLDFPLHNQVTEAKPDGSLHDDRP